MSDRVLVTGSRDYTNRPKVYRVLRNYHARHGISLIIEGGARGADRFAHDWAIENGVPVATFPADWARYGRAAGPVRNKEMLEIGQPDIVFAFPLGELRNTKGTKNMVELAQRARVKVEVCDHRTVWDFVEGRRILQEEGEQSAK